MRTPRTPLHLWGERARRCGILGFHNISLKGSHPSKQHCTVLLQSMIYPGYCLTGGHRVPYRGPRTLPLIPIVTTHILAHITLCPALSPGDGPGPPHGFVSPTQKKRLLRDWDTWPIIFCTLIIHAWTLGRVIKFDVVVSLLVVIFHCCQL